MFTFLVVNITIAICLAYTCFGCFKYLSPLNYKVEDTQGERGNDTDVPTITTSSMYVPQVLHPHPTERTILAHKQQQSYGTMDNTSSQAEGILSYSAGPALTEQASRSSV